MRENFDQIADDLWSIPGVIDVSDLSEKGVFGMCAMFYSEMIHITQLEAALDIFEDVDISFYDGYGYVLGYYSQLRDEIANDTL